MPQRQNEWGWLRRFSWWLYLRECEWMQTGIYLILGYKPGDKMPWFSPARITLSLDYRANTIPYFGWYRKHSP